MGCSSCGKRYVPQQVVQQSAPLAAPLSSTPSVPQPVVVPPNMQGPPGAFNITPGFWVEAPDAFNIAPGDLAEAPKEQKGE